MGSWAIWCWLAKIIRGSNQQVRIRRGVDKGSVPIRGFNMAHPFSEVFFSQCRLIKAMIVLWAREAGQSHLLGSSQAVGRSTRVGIKIFSIGEGLSFVGGLYHGFGPWLQGGPVRH